MKYLIAKFGSGSTNLLMIYLDVVTIILHLVPLLALSQSENNDLYLETLEIATVFSY